jgi:Holliday junction resolvasome RuvABC endonuclease subunit
MVATASLCTDAKLVVFLFGLPGRRTGAAKVKRGIVVGFDPGPTTSAYAVLDAAKRQVLDVGTFSSSSDSFDNDLAGLKTLWGGNHKSGSGATLWAIEKPEGFVFQPYRGPTLLDTAFVAGKIGGILNYEKVVTFSCARWRSCVCGKANADDSEVKYAITSFVELPKRTNEHVRDAIGVTIYAMLSN